jgi:hypothetical protein
MRYKFVDIEQLIKDQDDLSSGSLCRVIAYKLSDVFAIRTALMVAVKVSGSSVGFSKTTRRINLEDTLLHTLRGENLNSQHRFKLVR